MSTPPESDTDRIIAAHRDEARRTRVLLVWLLVGIPVLAGAIWLTVYLVAAHRVAASLDGTDDSDQAALEFVDTTSAAPTTTTDPNAPADFRQDIVYAHQVHNLSDPLYRWYARNTATMQTIASAICSANRVDVSPEQDAAAVQARTLLDQQHVHYTTSDINTLVTISTSVCPG